MLVRRMQLKVLLPFQVFLERPDVLRVVAETPAGSFGLLPQRLDCVAALVPGILVYETEAEGEVFLAVDAGVLVKAGAEVLVSVRRALAGSDLAKLRAALEAEFRADAAQEQELRAVLAKLETGFLRQVTAVQHD